MSVNEVKTVQRTLIKTIRLYCFVSRTISRNAPGDLVSAGCKFSSRLRTVGPVPSAGMTDKSESP